MWRGKPSRLVLAVVLTWNNLRYGSRGLGAEPGQAQLVELFVGLFVDQLQDLLGVPPHGDADRGWLRLQIADQEERLAQAVGRLEPCADPSRASAEVPPRPAARASYPCRHRGS